MRVEGSSATIGITDYAQHTLGSIVFVETPNKGKTLSKGEILGVVESVKAASDVFSPLSGTVTEANEELVNRPELLNESPYDTFIAVVALSHPEELKELLSAEEYEAYTKGE